MHSGQRQNNPHTGTLFVLRYMYHTIPLIKIEIHRGANYVIVLCQQKLFFFKTQASFNFLKWTTQETTHDQIEDNAWSNWKRRVIQLETMRERISEKLGSCWEGKSLGNSEIRSFNKFKVLKPSFKV